MKPREDRDAPGCADRVSCEAMEILASADAIDLHNETFIWTRLLGYDLTRRHGRGPFGGMLLSQLDLPRLLDSGLKGTVWSIATNPLRRRGSRTGTLLENMGRLRRILESDGRFAIVRDRSGYEAARARSLHACWLAVQGASALDTVVDVDRIRHEIVRMTLVHMSDSHVGATSNITGWRGGSGLTGFGRDLVRALDAAGILVDLAHASRKTFWDAMEVHDPAIPAIVSHTGVRGVFRTPRNIDDEQIKAIARTSGVVGIMAHTLALGGLPGTTADRILDHMEHAIRVAGEDFVALGSDWDGFIVTPPDMRTVCEMPVLVQRMLDRGWRHDRILGILGANFLRVLGTLDRRPPGVLP